MGNSRRYVQELYCQMG